MTTMQVKRRMFVSLRTKKARIRAFYKAKYSKTAISKVLDDDVRIGFFIMLVTTIALAFMSFQLTKAFLSDSGVSANNTFSAASEFPTPTGNIGIGDTSPTQHMVINEVSSFGDTDVEWIEIFNQSSSPIDVSGWKISDATSTDTLPSISPIPANGFGVIVASGSAVLGSIPGTAVTIQLTNLTIGNGLANASDSAKLLNPSDVIIDQMSYGTNTSVFPTPPAAATAGQTIRRSPNGVDTDTAADWVTNSSTSIGVAN